MSDKRNVPVRFDCNPDLLCDLDSYRSRFVTRTQMIEQAIKNYLILLEREGVPRGDGR